MEKIRAEVSIKIPFHDVDVMHIVWHGHYFKYFEIARTALMQSLGLDWPFFKNIGIAMPVVHAECNYKVPLEYDKSYFVGAEVFDLSYAEVRIEYEIFSRSTDQNSQQSRKITHCKASTRQVYLEVETKQLLFVVPKEVLLQFQNSVQQKIERTNQ